MTRKHKSNPDNTNSQNLSQIKTQPQQPSAVEILSQGEEASRLLDSPIYNLAHRSVIQGIQDEWMSTAPHEREKREGMYHRVRALASVAEEMALMVAKAQQITDDELQKERTLILAYDENSGFKL